MLRTGQLALAGLAIFGGFSAWQTIQPLVEIEVIQPEAGEPEFDPYFRITNGGGGTARNLIFGCVDYGIYLRDEDAYWPADWSKQFPERDYDAEAIPELAPGQSALRKCDVDPAPPGFTRNDGSMIAPIVTYRPEWALTRKDRTVWFSSHREREGGRVTWRAAGDGLSARAAEQMRARGQRVMTVRHGSHSPEWN
ncbi:MAG TPA: hypothetical protein VN018_07830 [Brevundimonas sp.]|nr:hypothetical protein [Brevundimonas sp.]